MPAFLFLILFLGLVSATCESLTDSGSDVFQRPVLRRHCSLDSLTSLQNPAPASDGLLLQLQLAPSSPSADRRPSSLAKYRLVGSRMVKRAMAAKEQARRAAESGMSPPASLQQIHSCSSHRSSSRLGNISQPQSKVTGIQRKATGIGMPVLEGNGLPTKKFAPGRFSFMKKPSQPLGPSPLSRQGGSAKLDPINVAQLPSPGFPTDSMNRLSQHAYPLVFVKNGKSAFQSCLKSMHARNAVDYKKSVPL